MSEPTAYLRHYNGGGFTVKVGAGLHAGWGEASDAKDYVVDLEAMTVTRVEAPKRGWRPDPEARSLDGEEFWIRGELYGKVWRWGGRWHATVRNGPMANWTSNDKVYAKELVETFAKADGLL